MSDWLTIGWYIIANKDHKIMCGEEYGEDRDIQHHDMSNDASPSHPHSQFAVFAFLDEHPIKDAFKFKIRGIQYYLKVIQCFILTHFYFRTNGSQHEEL